MTTDKAILFDLDDTLLGNHMETFLPGYFQKVSSYVAGIMDPEQYIDALIDATNAVVAQPDPLRSNYERFWVLFEEISGLSAVEQAQFLDTFYREIYPHLAALTQRREATIPLVEYCFAQGWQVIIATNPLFPKIAIEQRLAWAGLAVDAYEFALVTTMENMHATKPHVDYYEEILEIVGANVDDAVMIGDSWENDIEPTHKLGMRNFWIQLDSGPPPDPQKVFAWGSLDDFFARLRDGNIF